MPSAEARVVQCQVGYRRFGVQVAIKVGVLCLIVTAVPGDHKCGGRRLCPAASASGSLLVVGDPGRHVPAENGLDAPRRWSWASTSAKLSRFNSPLPELLFYVCPSLCSDRCRVLPSNCSHGAAGVAADVVVRLAHAGPLTQTNLGEPSMAVPGRALALDAQLRAGATGLAAIQRVLRCVEKAQTREVDRHSRVVARE